MIKIMSHARVYSVACFQRGDMSKLQKKKQVICSCDIPCVLSSITVSK